MVDEKRDTTWATIFPKLADRLGLSLTSNIRILDFGCGQGEFADEIRKADLDVSGTDFIDRLPRSFSEGLKAIVEHPYELPFQDSSFDLVVSQSVFEHVMDYDSAISEIRRVLKPDGVTIHGFPSCYRIFEPHVFVPAATLVRWKAWLAFWAYAGIRNRSKCRSSGLYLA